MRQFIYRVDAEDRIASVDATWVAFAVENGLPSLPAKFVIGTSLWDYLSEPSMQQFYRMFMTKVRKTGLPVNVPFRCDGPDCRRFMEMGIILLAGNALEFRSFLLREEPRPWVELFNPKFPRKAELLTVCAWCKKVKASGWLEAEDAVRELKLSEPIALPMISHGICPDCERALRRIAANG
jgi:hypothetical protein